MHADVAYSLDGDDRIVFVNAAWTAFAEANDGSHLLPPQILGRSLWEFIADSSTRQIYQITYRRVRAGAGPVTFPFRCDSPGMRRFLEMAITARPQARLDVRVRTLRLEARAPVSLLHPAAPRSSAVLRMCAWCKRIPDERGVWLEVEAALSELRLMAADPLPAISHGMCEECHASMLASVDFTVTK